MDNRILCIYYSRTGNTKQVMTEISEALDCELMEIYDNAKRSGALGYLRCGLDAMRKKTRPMVRLKTNRALPDYDLIIIGTPVWAGRCSSVVRGLLKRRGFEMGNVAYVITHKAENLYKDVYRQMDLYLQTPHVADVSLRVGSTGYHFWRDQFIKTCADFVSNKKEEN